ncbi:MAG: peptidase C39 [Lachnospiraceae bacterium]|nr:peptidase C39 [Lachnospiraceae bacterium]
MKNPLNYQITEYDCGPTTMMNAISFLFKREEIAPEITKSIMQYCLDSYNQKGEAYKSGTSDTAMWFLANWLNHFGKVRKFPILCENINAEEVRISENSRIMECLQQKGVVVAKVMLGCWHYVLLTGIDGEYVDLFDPYFRQKPFKDERIIMIWDEPKKRNRRVPIEILNSTGRGLYALGKTACRECVLIYNTKTRQTMDQIEYMI